MGKTGDSFARWYYGRGKGQQYLLCLIPVVVAIVAMRLIIPLLPMQEQEAAWGLKAPCPNSRVPIAQDDPLLDMKDLEGTIHRVCARAGDPR